MSRSVTAAHQRSLRRDVDIIVFIQLVSDIRYGHHDSEVFPDIAAMQLERLTNKLRRSELGARDLSILDTRDALALEAVDIFGERAAKGAQVVPLDDERDGGV